jgi:hypothetical protein
VSNNISIIPELLATSRSTINLGVQRRFDDPNTLAFVNEFDGTQMVFSGFINSVRIHSGDLYAVGESGREAVVNNYLAGPTGVLEPSARARQDCVGDISGLVAL